MPILLFIAFINISFASSFNAAKEAAAALKLKNPAGPSKSIPSESKTSISIEEESSDSEGLNQIICPKISNQFLNASTTTLRSMQDLYETYVQYEENTVNFYLTLLSYDKRNPEHEIAVGKLVEIERGVIQKLSRAKSNYNDEVKNMAGVIVRAKKCWSYHPDNDKKQISRFLEIFNKEKTLKDFKFCTQSKESILRLLKQHFAQTIRFYNKEISEKTYTTEFKKVEKELAVLHKSDKIICKDFTKNQKYDLYFQGKYEHKKEEENKEKPVSKPVKFQTPELGW